ncbi:hypothetical protein IFM89_035217, partial [Coptis chinensis]
AGTIDPLRTALFLAASFQYLKPKTCTWEIIMTVWLQDKLMQPPRTSNGVAFPGAHLSALYKTLVKRLWKAVLVRARISAVSIINQCVAELGVQE